MNDGTENILEVDKLITSFETDRGLLHDARSRRPVIFHQAGAGNVVSQTSPPTETSCSVRPATVQRQKGLAGEGLVAVE